MGRSGTVLPSIRMIPRGKTTEISVRSQPSIQFFPPPARKGLFRPFLGPKWNTHFLHATQKERCTERAECTQVTLFPCEYWVFEERCDFGPFFKRARFGKRPFWGPRGPRRASVDHIWSQLPSNDLMGFNIWSPHTLTWFQAP